MLIFLLISALSSYLQSNRNEFYKKIIQSKHDLERINLQLKEKNENLKNKNAELAKFTSVAAHDLRSPLRAIGSLVDMVLEDERLMSGESQERLNLVRKRAVRMDKLLTALSDYSQIDKKLGEPQEVNIQDILNNIISRYSHKNNIEFKSPESNFKIFTSKIALSRVFEEIITNAIKFNDKEFIQIDISAKKSNDTWHFSVRDNGPGIHDDFKSKVFVIFQTLEARDKFENAGAGLAIARKLVNESKGEIWLSSENNIGVTFHFTWKESNHQPKKVSPISDNPIRKSA